MTWYEKQCHVNQNKQKQTGEEKHKIHHGQTKFKENKSDEAAK